MTILKGAVVRGKGSGPAVVEVEGNRASGVEMALVTAHAVLVPRIERALEEALVAAIREILRNPGDPRPKLKVKSYAAFWRAMEEK